MRVISGKARGLKLDTPKNEDVRPTTDRVKESLFNIINPYIIDSNVLDLFAGTGSLGIECLSRGASYSTFVDVSKESINIVKSNIKKARVENESTILNIDFKSAIERLGLQNKKFDIIFIDPPYASGLYAKVLNELIISKMVKPTTLVICESDSNFFENDSGLQNKYDVKKISRYSRSMITILTPRKDVI